MRVYCSVRVAWAVALVASASRAPLAVSNGDGTAVAAKENPRFVVLGVDGKVVPDADPGLYLPTKLPTVSLEHLSELPSLPELGRVDPILPDKQSAPRDEQSREQRIDKRHGELLAQVVAQSVEDEDEFAGPIDFHLDVRPLELASALFLDSDVPAVQGSIIFAELSCFFVAFIGYLVHSIRLWSSFSRGQKCCLAVVFGSVALYQAAVSAWYVGALSSDAILGLSSLITRMISLGMVPITTMSFMGRARELCHEQHTDAAPGGSAGSSSRSSRRHRNHQRARYS